MIARLVRACGRETPTSVGQQHPVVLVQRWAQVEVARRVVDAHRPDLRSWQGQNSLRFWQQAPKQFTECYTTYLKLVLNLCA